MKVLFCSFNKYKTVSGEYINLIRLKEFIESNFRYEIDTYLPFINKNLFGYLRFIPKYILDVRKKIYEYDKVQIFIPSSVFLWIYYLILAWHPQKNKVIFYIDGLRVEDSIQLIFRHFRNSTRAVDKKIYLSRLLMNNRLLEFKLKDKFRYMVATEYQKRSLFPNANVHVIPNDYYLFKDICRKNKIPGRTIAYMGQFLYMKGIDYLIDLFIEIKKEDPSVNVEALVSFNYSERMNDEEFNSIPLVRKAIEKGIIFRREIIKPDEYLRGIDIVILPYKHIYSTNIIPSVIFETIKNGVYIYTVRHPLLYEFLKDNAGYLTFDLQKDSANVLKILPLAAELANQTKMRYTDEKIFSTRKNQIRQLYGC